MHGVTMKFTLSLCSSLNMSDQVSHPYTTTGNIAVPVIIIVPDVLLSLCVLAKWQVTRGSWHVYRS